jgi:predicted type IV restriction endonuclease
MFKKKIGSNNVEVVTGAYKFAVGSKFALNGRIWVVRDIYKDGSTDMIKIIADTGEEEIITLDTLSKDIKDVNSKFASIEQKQ